MINGHCSPNTYPQPSRECKAKLDGRKKLTNFGVLSAPALCGRSRGERKPFPRANRRSGVFLVDRRSRRCKKMSKNNGINRTRTTTAIGIPYEINSNLQLSFYTGLGPTQRDIAHSDRETAGVSYVRRTGQNAPNTVLLWGTHYLHILGLAFHWLLVARIGQHYFISRTGKVSQNQVNSTMTYSKALSLRYALNSPSSYSFVSGAIGTANGISELDGDESDDGVLGDDDRRIVEEHKAQPRAHSLCNDLGANLFNSTKVQCSICPPSSCHPTPIQSTHPADNVSLTINSNQYRSSGLSRPSVS